VFHSKNTIKITVIHCENAGDRGNFHSNFTVFASFRDDSATVLYVYNTVYHSGRLFKCSDHVILYTCMLRHVLVEYNSTVGSVYINRKCKDRYNDLEQGPDAWEFYKLY